MAEKTLTLEEATARIRMLESLVGLLLNAMQNHQHEWETRGESSCGCCPGPSLTHTTDKTIYIEELPNELPATTR